MTSAAATAATAGGRRSTPLVRLVRKCNPTFSSTSSLRTAMRLLLPLLPSRLPALLLHVGCMPLPAAPASATASATGREATVAVSAATATAAGTATIYGSYNRCPQRWLLSLQPLLRLTPPSLLQLPLPLLRCRHQAAPHALPLPPLQIPYRRFSRVQSNTSLAHNLRDPSSHSAPRSAARRSRPDICPTGDQCRPHDRTKMDI